MITFSSSLIEPVFSILAGRRSPPPPPSSATTDAQPVRLPGEFLESAPPSPSPPRRNYGVRVTDLRTPTAAGRVHQLARRDSALTMAAADQESTFPLTSEEPVPHLQSNASAASTKALEYRTYDLERRASSLAHQLAAEKAMTQLLDAKLRAADARLALAHDDAAAANMLYSNLRRKHAAEVAASVHKENTQTTGDTPGDDARAIEKQVAALQGINVGLKHDLDAVNDRIAQMQAAGEALQRNYNMVTAERDALAAAAVDGHGVRERDVMIAQLHEYIGLVARVVVQGREALGLEAMVRAGPPQLFIALLEQIVRLRDQVPQAMRGNCGGVLAQFAQMYGQTAAPVGMMLNTISFANASAPTPNRPEHGLPPPVVPVVPVVAPSVPAPAPLAPAPPPPVPAALVPPAAKRPLLLRGRSEHNVDAVMRITTPPPPPPPTVGDAMDVSAPATPVNAPPCTPLGNYQGWGAARKPATPATDNKWLARPRATPIANTRDPFGSVSGTPLSSAASPTPLGHRHGGGAGGALLRANAPGRQQRQPDTPRNPLAGPGAWDGGSVVPSPRSTNRKHWNKKK
ncbi:hypothetical protein GGF31_001942 [Allomyces arbusculus]|nr:hypothetical protein GGF31_001942 [Allomyces arbusculus]